MRKITVLILGIGLLFNSCESEEIAVVETTHEDVVAEPFDGGGGEEETGGSFLISCTLNGEDWSVSTGTSNYIDEAEGKQLNFTGEDGSLTLIFALGGTSTIGADAMELATYDFSTLHRGLVTIMESGEIVGAATGGGGSSAVSITLTEFNLDTRLCSGNFEFSGLNYETGEIEYEATGGIFANILF